MYPGSSPVKDIFHSVGMNINRANLTSNTIYPVEIKFHSLHFDITHFSHDKKYFLCKTENIEIMITKTFFYCINTVIFHHKLPRIEKNSLCFYEYFSYSYSIKYKYLKINTLSLITLIQYYSLYMNNIELFMLYENVMNNFH